MRKNGYGQLKPKGTKKLFPYDLAEVLAALTKAGIEWEVIQLERNQGDGRPWRSDL